MRIQKAQSRKKSDGFFLNKKPRIQPFPKTGRKQALQFLAGEIIGLQARIAKSTCKGQEGVEGRIIDETQNTVVLQAKAGKKRIAKATADFEFPKEGITVGGKILQGRPEDRTKKMLALSSRAR